MEPQPQRQMDFEKVSIEYFHNYMRSRIYYPDYQRGSVWELARRQRLIQTILSGRSIGTLTAFKRMNEDGSTSYGVTDGRQRSETIFFYLDGAFSTATQAQFRKMEPKSQVIQPGKSYNELSPYAISILNSYNIIIYSAPNEDDRDGQGESYRELNNYKRMTHAQILKSYPSKMNSVAAALSDHPFWVELYKGPRKGDERFRGALHTLVMQIAGDYIPQSDNVLREYSSGLKDNLVTDTLIETCNANLSIASHLFSKTKIGYPYEAIPMYQAVLFLLKDGCNLDHLEQGCFTNWYSDLQSESFKLRYAGGRSLFYKLATSEEQRYFWEHRGNFDKIKNIVRQAQKVTV